MTKEEFIKKFSKIEDTFEDEFKAEYNSPELIWQELKDILNTNKCIHCGVEIEMICDNCRCRGVEAYEV